MRGKRLYLSLIVICICSLAALPAAAAQAPQITGQYVEARTADVYTGPCFANSEVNLAGKNAVLAWHIERGTWGGVALDGLSVLAVVHASSTLGDPFSNPLPARAEMIVDQQASNAQRAALVNFAQTQANGLLGNVVAIVSSPIEFTVETGSRHSFASVQAGNLARITTRAITSGDLICHNEEVYYPPLAANLNHAMPAVAVRSSYGDSTLGVTWSESERRGSFVGTFAF